jgi:uncharacterized RDD family membrane protein YckC
MATPVTTSPKVGEQANGRHVDDPLDDLLEAYDHALTTIRTLPRIHRGGGIRVKHGIPSFRLRWGARHFAAFGISHTLRTLKRRYEAGAALDQGSTNDQERVERVEYYESSLPPVPGKRVILTSIALAGLLGYLVASILLPSVGADKAIGDMSGAVKSLDFEKAATIVRDDPTAALFAAGLLFSFLWAMTYPFLAAFRLKRLAFNLYPNPQARLMAADAPSDLRPLSEGIYRLEERAAGQVHVERPGEFPFDLVLQAASILIVFPLWVVAAFTLDDLVKNENLAMGMKAIPWVVGGGVLIWSPGRLLKLWRIWRRRSGSTITAATAGGPAMVTPAEVPVRHTVRRRVHMRATRKARAVAAVVDGGIVVVLAFVMGVAATPFANEDLLGTLMLLVFPPVAGAAYALAFRLKGRNTLGKRWQKIEVARPDGGPVAIYTLLAREGLFKWFAFGGLAIFALGIPFLANAGFALFSKDHRALHDRLARTEVVQIDGA